MPSGITPRTWPATTSRSAAVTRAQRRPDPRIGAQIRTALGDARRVVNVGAGAGSYEPDDRDVVAVEPSAVMQAQRPPGAAPCVTARAEALPFADREFDAALAVLTVHHWGNWRTGCAELRRVAPRRVVLTWDPAVAATFWLVAEYLPGLLDTDRRRFPATLADSAGARRGPRRDGARSPTTAPTASSARTGARPSATSTPPCAAA